MPLSENTNGNLNFASQTRNFGKGLGLDKAEQGSRISFTNTQNQ
jgi:hypothetical protein